MAIYEAYSIILTSIVLGTIIGFVIAAMVTAQLYLFLEFPFMVTFPTKYI